jgi:serine phosphatase RsbU (regulator of sigma subunit)
MNHPRLLWFKGAAAAGAGLAILLLGDSVFTYRYVSTRFAHDQALVQAVQEVSSLEHELRREGVGTVDGLQRVLSQVQEDRSDEIPWMRVIHANQVQAASGSVEPHPPASPDRMRAILERRENYSAIQDTARGEVLIALLPVRLPFPPEEPENRAVLEIAIYLRGEENILHPLSRDLLISALAAVLLLASMSVFFFRLPAYVRGRTLEDQRQLARAVQRRLLPGSAGGNAIEFAGECLPAGAVGGDFYDVFRTQTGKVALVLADVSGKGLPAALRMGIVHGAIRALARAKIEPSAARMAANLNDLLREGTSGEFVTLFWGLYDPAARDLHYVNAGHPPPLLVSSKSDEVRRLETGGPVLGLLPNASYQEECIDLDGEETLIAYSDGLLEAANPAGEEFGESRLLPLVRASPGSPAHNILRSLMDEAVRFAEGVEFHDDLTILVAKLEPEGAAPAQPRR